MSDFVKIVVFSLFLSALWVIPRLNLIFQWISSHIWYSSAIAVSIVCLFLLLNWVKQKRSHRHLLNEQGLNVDKQKEKLLN